MRSGASKMKKFDIEFWHSDCEKAFKKIRKELIARSDMNEEEVTELLEGIYYLVANEYGGC